MHRSASSRCAAENQSELWPVLRIASAATLRRSCSRTLNRALKSWVEFGLRALRRGFLSFSSKHLLIGNVTEGKRLLKGG